MGRFEKFRKSLKDFWQNNMERDYKKISAGLGVLLITVIWAVADLCITAFSGGNVDWSSFSTKITIGVATLGTLVASSFFGRERNNNNSDSEEPHT